MFVQVVWRRKRYAHDLACNGMVVDLDIIRLKVIQLYRRTVEVGGDEVLPLGQDEVRPFPEIQAMEIFMHTGEVYQQI